MKIMTKVPEVQEYVKKLKKRGNTIGFVPTMGYLHEGHISLVEKAAAETQKVIVSIFVNPTQFGPNEDFGKYPRNEKRDLKMLKATKKVSCVFMPDRAEMYADDFATYVNMENYMTGILEGASRPGHFRGVTTVVAKLLNIVQPDKLFLGQKDFQQAAILTQMVKDMNYPASVVICPTVREKDGLAMSSRNTYLSEAERQEALIIFKSLQMAESMIELGEHDAEAVLKEIRRKIKEANVEIDYVEAFDAITLKKVDKFTEKSVIAIAAMVGKTRLIDNTIIEIKI